MAKITGTLLDDTIVGNVDEKDSLNGAAGNDVLYGYGDGSGIGGTPPPSLPDGGTADNDTLIGGIGNDTLFGGGGNDKLDGGIGADSMDGGDQDDIYYVDDKNDVAAESNSNAFGGTDLVISSATECTLGGGIENLTLVGKNAITGTGNALNNFMLGSAIDNVLIGEGGNDTLDGGAGADALSGGLGDDTYVIDNVNDLIFESAGLGTDTLRWMRNVNLDLNASAFANIENAALLGSASISLTGTAGNNALGGNAGANVIDGGGGADTMAGGGGNDTYILDGSDFVYEAAGGGTDHVISSDSYSLSGQAIENLTLTGTASQGFGNELANIIIGNDIGNEIFGEGGADKMTGGKGNDSYYVDNAGDKVIELNGEGLDTIFSTISLTIPVNVEILRLDGSANINATGSASSDELYGNDGNNKLDGKAGADTMNGGEGNDIMMVDNAGDVTSDFGSGLDRVFASADHTIGAGIEELTLTGKAVSGVGNNLANRIVGNAAGNLLYGNAGHDTLDGGAGADFMDGGDNSDTYYVDNAGDGVEDTGSMAIVAFDRVNSSVTFTLHASVENLTLVGAAAINGTGNFSDNEITGNKGANKLFGLNGMDTLIGNAGNDTLDGYAADASPDSLVGGAGNDVYFVGAGDVAIEDLAGAAGGIDKVISNVNITIGTNIENLTLIDTAFAGFGNDLNNVIIGNDIGNFINGQGGADTMIGGGGDDSYGVNNAGDVVKESSGGGHDSVASLISYTLSAEVEDLAFLETLQDLKGTGNGLDNKITGSRGDDTLNGMSGADTLNGGDDGNDALNGGDGTDTLNGGVGNDTLNGGGGADLMDGGDGSDTMIVDNVGDVTKDTGSDGEFDRVFASVNHTLGDFVEYLTLTGKANINGTGNALLNVIEGNSGANILDGKDNSDNLSGGGGNDTLIGGAGSDNLHGGAGFDVLDGGIGSDRYTFDKSSSGKDTILTLDIGPGGDILDLSEMLVGYAEGVSNPNDFLRIVFAGGNMVLQVDANGLAGGAKFTDLAVLASFPDATVDQLMAGGNLQLAQSI